MTVNSKASVYSKAIVCILTLLIISCTSTVQPDLSSLQTANDVVTASNVASNTVDTAKEVVTASRDVVNYNSLEWWQWLIIGMFIPAPWEMIGSTIRSIFQAIRGR